LKEEVFKKNLVLQKFSKNYAQGITPGLLQEEEVRIFELSEKQEQQVKLFRKTSV